MSNLGTFDTFTAAQLGIYAAQHGLRVTGNNISNISTEGYTRQRIDQVSFKVGAGDMYRSQLDNHVGSGALVTGISQIRDPYLDIRFRNTNSDVGYNDTWLDGLQNIAAILDEVGSGFGEDNEDGLLYAQLQDLADALRGLSENPSSDDDILVRTSAEALCTLFNTYADKLQTLKENTDNAFRQDIAAVNGILTNIRNLNEEIRNSDIHGDSALEMRDERNRQIDALSEYIHINVVYSMEDIGAGQQVEKLTISLANDNPDGSVTTDSSMLIDGIYGAQISMQRPMMNPDFDPTQDVSETNMPFWNAEDGKPVLTSAEATLEDSPNYDITISRMYDSRGRVWTNPVTTRTEVETERQYTQAKYSYELKTSAWGEDDVLTIAGTDYTIGTDIPLDTANNLVSMAAFIADALNAAHPNGAYTAKGEGNQIVFTAKTVPTNDSEIPAPPTLELTDGREHLVIGSIYQINPGYNVVPANVDNLKPVSEYNKDPLTGATLSRTDKVYTQVGNKWYEVTTVTEYSREITLDDNDLHGSLQATRELLTEAGEFSTQDTVDNVDENALIKRGIPYYQLSLDLLARQVATQYNNLNHGYMVNQDGNYIDANGKEVLLPGTDTNGVGVPISKTDGLTAGQAENLTANGYILKDQYGNDVLDENGKPVPDILAALKDLGAMPAEGMGNLFSVRNDLDDDVDADGNGITASNITVSRGWSTGDFKVITTYVQLFGEDGEPLPNTTQNENVNHMITMIEKPLVYDPKLLVQDAAGEKLFTGGFNDMFGNIMSVQGKDQRLMNVKLVSSYGSLVELDSSREGVSGVDLNDEAMNMMQYQKAYSAACRLMTVIDSVLDRLINNTGTTV